MDKYYENGSVKAKFIKYLKPGDCGCEYDKKPNYYVDGNKVYKRIEFKFRNNAFKK